MTRRRSGDLQKHLAALERHAPEVFGLEGPVDEHGFYATRQIADGAAGGFWLAVEPQIFRRARLGISVEAADSIDEAFAQGYFDIWDYASRAEAIVAMNEWNGVGEPTGWVRSTKSEGA